MSDYSMVPSLLEELKPYGVTDIYIREGLRDALMIMLPAYKRGSGLYHLESNLRRITPNLKRILREHDINAEEVEPPKRVYSYVYMYGKTDALPEGYDKDHYIVWL